MATAKESKKRIPFLQTHSSVRPYRRGDLDQVFIDMKSEMKEVVPVFFFEAITMVGTHAPKLVAARNKTNALLLNSSRGNAPGTLAGSGNAQRAQYMKVALRPICIEGEPGEMSLFERLQGPGDPDIETAFENVFGTDALNEVRRGLVERQQPMADKLKVSAKNYPIFFIPREDGGDLQAAPGGSIEAHSNMKSLMVEMKTRAWEARRAGEPFTIVEWRQRAMADKPQNIIVGAPMERTRFRVDVPEALTNVEAEIWAYQKNKTFPRMADEEAGTAMIDFAFELKRFAEDRDAYRGNGVKERLVDNRAKFIVMRAQSFIDDTIHDLVVGGVSLEDITPPGIKDVLASIKLYRSLINHKTATKDDWSFVIASLNSPEFSDALKKHGKQQ